MERGIAALLGIVIFGGLWAQGLAGAPAPAVPAAESENAALERFLADVEKPPVAYQARRRLEAASAKLNESAWMEAVTTFDPKSGFTYTVTAAGGSERIQQRVLKSVLETEREQSMPSEWRKATLSRDNYEFNFGGRTDDGMLRLQLMPRRRDTRLVTGSALLTAVSGDLVRVDGRLSKSPSFWVRWVKVSRAYSPVGGRMMPVVIESTADVRIAGISTFSMEYDYQMVDGHAVHTSPKMFASR